MSTENSHFNSNRIDMTISQHCLW